MAVVLKEIIRVSHKFIYLDNDPRTEDWPIASSPLLVATIIGVYIQFVLKWGPAFMKTRKPFELNTIIQVYNVIQVVVCAYVVYVGYAYGFGHTGTYKFWCEPVDYSGNEISTIALKTVYIYFLLKVTDLLDTVFFVLRKKDSQISFLHVYHHSGMVALSWGGFRYYAGGSITMIGWVNSMVHVFMYTYYFLTSWDPELRKNVWWKKYITQIQIVQFLFFCIYAANMLIRDNCGFPKLPWALFIPQNVFMLIMFADFYKRAYLSKRTEEKN